jgi:hypothetical protein
MPDTKTGHVRWGSWDFDYDVSGFEGLSLLNGTYRGRTAIGKFSMPAIRVRYLVDGGPLDWRRPLKQGAGPYADRLRWKLGGKYGLQRIANRDNQYVGLETYFVGTRAWVEVSIYARIGAYHISQQWHLSEDGWVRPRVWSKGLTINMDHWHHPYWRLDFDIDGQDFNSVFVRNFGTWSQYLVEANDTKNSDPRANTVWFVLNEATGAGVWIIPSKKPPNAPDGIDDGFADSFSRLDVGVRRYNTQEELSPWVYTQGPIQEGPLGIPVPVPTWDWQFDTGELGFLNGQTVSARDIVFWYAAHLPHRASEGADAWHGCGPNLKFDFHLPAPTPPRDFGILVNVKRNQTGNDTTVKGRGFTPGGSVIVNIQGIPNRATIKRFPTADALGKFTVSESFGFTSHNPDDAFGTVEIFAFDVTTGLLDKWTGNAAPWVAP